MWTQDMWHIPRVRGRASDSRPRNSGQMREYATRAHFFSALCPRPRRREKRLSPFIQHSLSHARTGNLRWPVSRRPASSPARRTKIGRSVESSLGRPLTTSLAHQMPKPLIERKRRARINRSLGELEKLLSDLICIEVSTAPSTGHFGPLTTRFLSRARTRREARWRRPTSWRSPWPA